VILDTLTLYKYKIFQFKDNVCLVGDQIGFLKADTIFPGIFSFGINIDKNNSRDPKFLTLLQKYGHNIIRIGISGADRNNIQNIMDKIPNVKIISFNGKKDTFPIDQSFFQNKDLWSLHIESTYLTHARADLTKVKVHTVICVKNLPEDPDPLPILFATNPHIKTICTNYKNIGDFFKLPNLKKLALEYVITPSTILESLSHMKSLYEMTIFLPDHDTVIENNSRYGTQIENGLNVNMAHMLSNNVMNKIKVLSARVSTSKQSSQLFESNSIKSLTIQTNNSNFVITGGNNENKVLEELKIITKDSYCFDFGTFDKLPNLKSFYLSRCTFHQPTHQQVSTCFPVFNRAYEHFACTAPMLEYLSNALQIMANMKNTKCWWQIGKDKIVKSPQQVFKNETFETSNIMSNLIADEIQDIVDSSIHSDEYLY
jgi:hypothetical protein